MSTILFPKEGPLPAGRRGAHIVMLGSTCSVYDEGEARAWIDEELAWLRRADAAGVPVLGICFGAQVLAAALGGTVDDGGRQEIGWVMIDTIDPELIPPGPWLEFHDDTCLPPPRATILARNDLGVQAFRSAGTWPSSSTPRSTATSSGCGWTRARGSGPDRRGQDPDAMLAETIGRSPAPRPGPTCWSRARSCSPREVTREPPAVLAEPAVSFPRPSG